MIKSRIFVASLIVFLISFSAFAAKTFTFRIANDPETLDWTLAHTSYETHVLMSLMEGLVNFDKELNIKPELSESYSISKDGKTYTFKIRKNVKWSDGVPLKAEDFLYSWKRLLSPITAASYAYLLFDVEGAEEYNQGKVQDFSLVGIKVIDSSTLQVKLKNPVSYWIYLPSFWVMYPLREDIIQKYGTGWAKPGRMVTVGPYILSSFDLDSKIVMSTNPHYYGKRGNVEKINALIIKDDTTALNLYESGKLDFCSDLSSMALKKVQNRSDLKQFPYLKTGYFGFSTNAYPVSQKRFRRAIAQAIDKSKISEILYGHQIVATSFVPPPLLGYSKTLGLPFNVAQAKKDLIASGVKVNDTLKIDFLTTNWDKNVVLVQYLQNQLKQHLGLKVEIQAFDHKTFRSQLDLHVMPLFSGSWAADYPDVDNFLSIFQSGVGNNRFSWKNEKFDELIRTSRSIMQPKVREANYVLAQKILLEDEAVVVPLFYEPNLALVKPRVKGFFISPINQIVVKDVMVDD